MRLSRSKFIASAASVVLVAWTAGGVPVHADDRKNDREARRAQLLEQRLQQEESQWDQQRADLQKQLGDAQASATAQKAELDKAQSGAAALQKERDALKVRVADLEKQLASTQRASQEALAAKAKEIETFTAARVAERAALNRQIDDRSQQLSVCTQKNAKLVAFGHELLQKYRDKGVLASIRQEEPFLGFGDVETFNLVQAGEDTVASQQVAPPEASKSKAP